MKVYSYVVRNDRGLIPNPFWDYCTIAIGQPLIRQIAEVGDWVVGLKEISEKLVDHMLLFAMQITEKITYDDYWSNPRFQIKRPDFSVEEEIFRVGDNIYEPGDDGSFTQHYSLHSVTILIQMKYGKNRNTMIYKEDMFLFPKRNSFITLGLNLCSSHQQN